MKHTSILATILFGVLSCSQAATIALWTFESPNTPSPTTNLTISGVLPATGSGTLSGVHAGLTVFYPQAGNGSTYSLGADSWLPGDYWQVHVSTRGLDHIQLSWDQNTNPYGPTNFNLGFSTDGATFTTIAPFIPVSTIGWQLNTRDPNATVSFNLSSWTALNDAPDVYFRLSSNLNRSEERRVG